MPRPSYRILLMICLTWLFVRIAAFGQETNPGRAPTGGITNPGQLFNEVDGVEFRFGYFPSQDRLRLLILSPADAFVRWECALRASGSHDVLRQYAGKLPMASAGETVVTPALGDGTYELLLTLHAKDGTRQEIVRTFERKHFVWEKNWLGRYPVVTAPFTPLVTDVPKASVNCLLRKHELDGTGLWKQVFSQERPLLAAPMRLEVESRGQTHVADGGPVTFTVVDNVCVRGNASWHAGPLQGRTEFDFDYDGLTKITLGCSPTSERIDAMQLVIPMLSDETWLMHPVTDLLRFHYAGRIPAGKNKLWDYAGKLREVHYTETGEPDASGKVWDSRHVGRHQLPAPFVPYIWLGGTERGICWFAENDRDWSVDPSRPALEIRRQGKTTSLVVHLVTKPLVFARSRRITFGLMATPAKPRPVTPMSCRRWWPGQPSETADAAASWGFLGSCYYWGGASPSNAFWPVNKNEAIYHEYKRVRRYGTLDPKFVDRWLAQYTPEELRLAQASAERYKPDLTTYRRHVNWSLNLLATSRPQRPQSFWVIPYLNARAASCGEEVRTFTDEWSTCDIADPRWPGEERFLREKRGGGFQLATFRGKVIRPCQAVGISYAIDPVPSWQDMALHYGSEMLDTFADGLYFDDCFLSPNYNPLGPGYVDDEGKLHAGVAIFAFHDFIKRAAGMMELKAMHPLVYVHMTNGNIVPILSFATMMLDHEWRDGGEWTTKDAQERLYLDEDTSLLLAESTGLQSGCLAVYHDLFHGDERLCRSALGVSLTHEMKFGRGWWPAGRTAAEQLNAFGYGLPDCRVWRYWDASLPVQTGGAVVKPLVLARGGKAMIVVASYGPAGDVTLTLDRNVLGLADRLTATNVEDGQRLEQTAPGVFRLPMPRHDFRIIRIEEAGK